ncbi:ATP-dependent helicase [Niallia circulans]
MGYIVNVGTFHGICKRILLDNEVLSYDQKQIQEYQYKQAFSKIIDNPNLDDIMSYINYQKCYLKGENDTFVYKESGYTEEQLRVFYKKYEQIKKSLKLYDFNDLLIKTYELQKQLKLTYEYVLVDEYQDSNLIQNKLLEQWCQSGNLFTVFDVKQSLYEWNGAVPSYCMEFEKHWKGAKVINLNTNYRSAKNIVEKANDFIKPYYQHYEHHKDSVAHKTNDGEITLDTFVDREEEGVCVANKIEQLIANGTEPRDIAVLYRNNKHAEYVESQLKRKGIEYEISNGASFFDRKEIAAVINILRLLVNPHDDMALDKLYEIRIYPLMYFSKVIYKNIKSHAGTHNLSYFESFCGFHKYDKYQKRNQAEFEKSIQQLRLQKDKGVSLKQLLNNIIKAFRLEKYIYDSSSNTEEAEDRLGSFNVLRGLAKSDDIDKLLSFASQGLDFKKKKKNAVKLMTLHGSKGLEFLNVFLIGVEDRAFPSEKATLLEEARLFYVGISRSIENLYLSQIGKENQFIKEYFGESLVEQ